jgi:hypothetical protein
LDDIAMKIPWDGNPFSFGQEEGLLKKDTPDLKVVPWIRGSTAITKDLGTHLSKRSGAIFLSKRLPSQTDWNY